MNSEGLRGFERPALRAVDPSRPSYGWREGIAACKVATKLMNSGSNPQAPGVVGRLYEW